MRALAFSGGKDSMACLHLCKSSIDIAIHVDTGKSYPETRKMVAYANTIVPVVVVESDREGQNEREGIPSDVVPVDYTTFGQSLTGEKAVKIQSYHDCHFQNIGLPLLLKAAELGVTSLILGQRNDDRHKSTAKDGDMIEGITRLHPIEGWTDDDVFNYLRSVMVVPLHYYRVEHSSLDCYDCTAFTKSSKDRIEYTKETHPEFHAQYLARMESIRQALKESGYVEA